MNITTSPGAAVSMLLGVGVGLGLVLIMHGSRARDPARPPVSRRVRPAHLDRRRAVQIGTALGVGVLTGVATGWVVGAVLAGLAVWTLPRLLGRDPEHARRIARIEAIATWTEMLRDTLAAAAGLEQACLATAPLAPLAIRAEITELTARIENGERLVPSLRRLAQDLADPTGDLVIAALVLAAEQQAGHLADLLGSLAQTARKQAWMRLSVEAGRARIRTSVRVIVGTTLGFAVVVVLLNRGYLSAFDSITGQIVLLVIGVLFGLGFVWLTRIAVIEDPERLLAVFDDGSTDRTRPVPERRG